MIEIYLDRGMGYTFTKQPYIFWENINLKKTFVEYFTMDII